MKVESDAFIRKGDGIRAEIDGDGDLTIRVGEFVRPSDRHPSGGGLTLFVHRDALAAFAVDLAEVANVARAAAIARAASGVIEAKPTGGA